MDDFWKHFRFEPPFPAGGLVLLGMGLFVAWGVLRIWLGKASPASRHHASFWILRLISIAALLFILAGPTRVEETFGKPVRPNLLFLLDSSKSMDLGADRSRWMEATTAIDLARAELSDDIQSSLQTFRFGHRISALSPNQKLPELKPTDSETRLAEALRQLTGRFGRRPPAGIVLFSDGQVRSPDAVLELARHYQGRGIPIHVYPPPVTANQGDIAIVAAVAPPRIRKYANVDVHVFLRSSGYSGQRTEVSLVVPSRDQQPEEILASVPISLRGGVQSVPLMYRSDDQDRKFEVRIAKMPEELTGRNNILPMEVRIERPKIRVLYVDGSQSLARMLQSAGANSQSPPQVLLQTALLQDNDIDSILLVRNGRTLKQSPKLVRGNLTSFPRTRAELSDFDCVILSDVPAELLTQQQLEWLKDWVERRGGGLLMTGGPDSFAAGGWKSTPLADVLPVTLEEARWDSSEKRSIRPVEFQKGHPVWQLVPERDINQKLLEQMPSLPFATLGLRPKPGADILAVLQPISGTIDTSTQEWDPMLVTGQDGLGRTMAMAWQTSSPDADPFLTQWGKSSSKNAAKFWRNIIYWLSENSYAGRRRLVARVDKQFYRPGETIQLNAVAYNELALPTPTYHLWGMIEPKSYEAIGNDMFAPVRWPEAAVRSSGEQSPKIIWGEEFEIPVNPETLDYLLPLKLTDHLAAGLSDQGFRIELTAYEGTPSGGISHGTQIDSTSLEVQVLDDPFEQQNTSVNHELLQEVAAITGGELLKSPDQLIQLAEALPVETGPSIMHRTPMWPQWWLWGLIGAAWTVEWLLRRSHGLA